MNKLWALKSKLLKEELHLKDVYPLSYENLKKCYTKFKDLVMNKPVNFEHHNLNNETKPKNELSLSRVCLTIDENDILYVVEDSIYLINNSRLKLKQKLKNKSIKSVDLFNGLVVFATFQKDVIVYNTKEESLETIDHLVLTVINSVLILNENLFVFLEGFFEENVIVFVRNCKVVDKIYRNLKIANLHTLDNSSSLLLIIYQNCSYEIYCTDKRLVVLQAFFEKIICHNDIQTYCTGNRLAIFVENTFYYFERSNPNLEFNGCLKKFPLQNNSHLGVNSNCGFGLLYNYIVFANRNKLGFPIMLININNGALTTLNFTPNSTVKHLRVHNNNIVVMTSDCTIYHLKL